MTIIPAGFRNLAVHIVGDLDALGQIAHFLDEHTELGKRYEFDNMLVNLRKSLLRELDKTGFIEQAFGAKTVR